MSRNLAKMLFIAVACLLVTVDVMAFGDERVFYQIDASNGLADNSAQTIKTTKSGRMVISTIGHINFYDGAAFTHIDPSPSNVFPLPKYNGHYRMMFDCHHHLWLKDKHAVTCVDLRTERFIDDVGEVFKQWGISQRVDDMFGDGEGHIWILSDGRLYDDSGNKVLSLDKTCAELQDVDVDTKGRLLLFFGDGCMKAYDKASGRLLYEVAALTGADKVRYASTSVLLRDGSRYYQIRNGIDAAVLLCYDSASRQWERLMETPYHMNNMALRNKVLYVASQRGYLEYDLETKKTHPVETLTLSKGRTLKTDVNTLCFDRQGGLWIGTERRGLLYSKPTLSPFKVWQLDDVEAAPLRRLLEQHATVAAADVARRINCRFRDSRGWQWTGTYQGLELLKPSQKKPRVLGRKDGLMNEMIHSVIEDDGHHIWVGTSYGISYLSIDSGKIEHVETFTSYDGVPNESFVNGAALKCDDGTIVMQTLDHIITFNPKTFYTDTAIQVSLYPKLVGLLVNGRKIAAGQNMEGRVILEKAISRVRELTVNYNQNSLSLTFSALNYFRPIQTYYRFRVKGIFDDWRILSHTNSNGLVDSRGLLHLPLAGLPPGTYTIEVQASMLPDTWREEPLSWIIHVEQPWWRTTLVYILLLVLLAVLALVNAYFFYRNMHMRMTINNEERDIIKRIKYYATRCDHLTGEVLTPYSMANSQWSANNSDSTNKVFMDAMLKIVPFVWQAKDKAITMPQLADVAGIDTATLQELIAANLYKSPRQLASRLRLQQVAELLPKTDMSVEELAERFNFVSPNYLISSFYHQYRMTPKDYRNSKAR